MCDLLEGSGDEEAAVRPPGGGGGAEPCPALTQDCLEHVMAQLDWCGRAWACMHAVYACLCMHLVGDGSYGQWSLPLPYQR
eukprot:355767-Chlamydomonas_euryale.AAC.11